MIEGLGLDMGRAITLPNAHDVVAYNTLNETKLKCTHEKRTEEEDESEEEKKDSPLAIVASVFDSHRTRSSIVKLLSQTCPSRMKWMLRKPAGDKNTI